VCILCQKPNGGNDAECGRSLSGRSAGATTRIGGSKFATQTGRHSDGANYEMADGHVKWLRIEQVSVGQANSVPNDPGTTAKVTPTCGANAGNFNSANVTAAATGNSTFAATYSYL